MQTDPTPSPERGKPLQPLWLRATHWINALAVLIMVMSGWRIYDASPLFDVTFPAGITLGGLRCKAGRSQWPFLRPGT
ncbi:Thiosulfate reductase cytochrome b subunit OS=Castellaniella defragrans OX=75697 GN=HNR28_000154 PE=3 SV=1 [Castellaniella denitrificans]